MTNPLVANTVTILGGSGFLGTELCNQLTKQGYRLRVLTRRRDRAKHLTVFPTLDLHEVDVHDERELAKYLAGSGAAINLVGILNEKRDNGRGFTKVHVELVEKLANACRQQHVPRLLQLSALGAGPDAPSYYLKSKGAAESLLQTANSESFSTTIFRPSVMFGAGDDFLNRFATLLRFSPGVLPLASADSRLAPIYVGDVAQALCRSLQDPSTAAQSYDLCGPETYTLKQLVTYTSQLLGIKRLVMPLPAPLGKLQGLMCEFVPGKPFSRDNYRSLTLDSISAVAANDLAALGIDPKPLRTVVPDYIHPPRPGGRYGAIRAHSR